jgi:hypothetical protein
MEAVTWTVIAVLGASVFGSFGAFFYLGTKIDELGGRLDGRIDALGARLDSRIDAQAGDIRAMGTELTTRLDAVATRLDALNARMDDHARRHAG